MLIQAYLIYGKVPRDNELSMWKNRICQFVLRVFQKLISFIGFARVCFFGKILLPQFLNIKSSQHF